MFGQVGLWYPLESVEDVDSSTETEFKFGAKYKFYENFAASASYSMMDDMNIMNIGATYYLD